MGYSRDTFYRVKQAYESGGEDALLEVNRRKPNLKNRIDEQTEEAVVAFALENPAFGQKRTSDELRRRGIFISAGGVRCVWLRNGLASFQQRLHHLEEHIAKTGNVLTERQLLALERAKEEKIVYGEIETEHVGYLGSQDTFYVGIIKGVGRVYQQTFIDTYSGVGFAKLYTTKQSITAADILNDRVLPFFERYNLPMLRILTDRGTEYCGKADEHDYQLFLAVNDIDHTRTKTKSPQTNGICERFNKTLLEEFYMLAFRKKIYNSVDELQTDLDRWLVYYNESRPHQGKRQQGRTPMETFMDNLGYALGKNHAKYSNEFAVGDDLTVMV
jgi:transposase InsO family protein